MSKDTVLIEAHKVITGPRKKAYGDPLEGFERIAGQWWLYLTQKHAVDVTLTAEDVCWMMALVKMARQMQKHDRDNLVDAAGYIGLIEEVL